MGLPNWIQMKSKNTWLCILFLLAGLVIGGLLGNLASNVGALSWLNYGKEFGISSPFILDLSFLKLTFGIICIYIGKLFFSILD